MRRGLVLLVGLVVAAPSVAAAQQPADYGGVRNVFSGGQGEQLSPPEAVAVFAGAAQPPPSYTSQIPLYRDIVYAAPGLTTADLDKYFKPGGFAAPEAVASSIQPRPGVTILRDADHFVPRVYGETRADTFFGVGYATAQDRLFQMDVLRYERYARLGEFLGAANIAADGETVQVYDYSAEDVAEQFDELAVKWGDEGRQVQDDLRAYVDGINAYVAETATDSQKLPGEYAAFEKTPQPWTVYDVMFMNSEASVGVAGGGAENRSAALMAAFQKRFGRRRGLARYEDFRRRDDPESPVVTPRRYKPQARGKLNPAAVALPDPGSYEERNAVVSGGSGSASTARGPAIRRPADVGRSNALLVSGRRSESGHPLAVMGPQGGHGAPHPSIMEIEMHGPGIDARGVTWYGTLPYVELGRGIDFAWSITVSYEDTADMFAEKLCEPGGEKPSRDSGHYLYDGQCIPFESREITYTTTPNVLDQSAPRDVTIRTQRSVHGPIRGYATVRGEPVALAVAQSTQYNEASQLIHYARLAAGVRDVREWRRAAQEDGTALGFYYADDRDIAYQDASTIPIRAEGTHPDLPTWGTGEFDWRGFDPEKFTFDRVPAKRNPHAVNPSRDYITAWNVKPARGWQAGDKMFNQGSITRASLLERGVRAALAAERRLDLADVTRVVQLAATRDMRGYTVYRWLRRAIGKTRDPELKPLLEALGRWVADGAHRRDLDQDGVYEHSAAVALFDAWWEPLLRGIFQPVLGKGLVDGVAEINPFLHRPEHGGAYRHGWQGYVHKDIRRVLGRRVRGPFSRRYCGRGSRAKCRAILIRTLKETAAKLRAERGDDMSKWEVPATCGIGGGVAGRCDQIDFIMSGAAQLPPIPFQNRPTFQQIIEFDRHRPR